MAELGAWFKVMEFYTVGQMKDILSQFDDDEGIFFKISEETELVEYMIIVPDKDKLRFVRHGEK